MWLWHASLAGWGYNSWLGLERENSWRTKDTGEEVPSGREGRKEGGRKRQRDRGSKAERTKEEREVREEEGEESGKEREGGEWEGERKRQRKCKILANSCTN